MATYYILLFPTITDDITIITFAVLIVIMGLSRLINGLFDKGLKNITKISKIVVGFIILALGILTYFSPTFGEIFVILFLSLALLINGIMRILAVGSRKEMGKAVRILLVVLGVLMILLSGFVLIAYIITGFNADFTEGLMIGLLALTLQLSGIGRLISGISGYRITTTKTETELKAQKEKKKLEKEKKKLEKEKRKEEKKKKKE